MSQVEHKPHFSRDERMPSQVTGANWIGACRQAPGYPLAGDGKWLIHARRVSIDNLWRIVKLATEEGYLGSASKVSTGPLARAGIHTMCVYTYSREDQEDILRIREALRELGIEQKISYAAFVGQEQVSLYYE